VAYDDIDGLGIEPGTSVFLSIRHIQRNPEVFESPEQFQPGRFIQPKHPQFAFIPFGGGVRVCPGGALAVVEAAASLKLLFQRYRMKALTKEPVIEGLITASLKSPLLVQLQRREGT
jgi:cytochrome P450